MSITATHRTTTRRLATAVASALLGGALAAGAGIGWDSAGAEAVTQAAALTKGSVVANGIGWD
ncbi:hypothetical protein [Streptomyces sp. NPDC058872]|uniref:hypothetical protein n=1 Tax=Streptomyces sp. NPDC058872 TaxID=3346661 RepID=UPI00367C25D6